MLPGSMVRNNGKSHSIATSLPTHVCILYLLERRRILPTCCRAAPLIKDSVPETRGRYGVEYFPLSRSTPYEAADGGDGEYGKETIVFSLTTPTYPCGGVGRGGRRGTKP